MYVLGSVGSGGSHPPLFPPFVLYRIAGVSGHGGTRGGARRAPTHTSAFYANATVTTLHYFALICKYLAQDSGLRTPSLLRRLRDLPGLAVPR